MRTCSVCNVSKRNLDFISKRGKYLKMCIACRNKVYIPIENRPEDPPPEKNEKERDDQEKKENKLSLDQFIAINKKLLHKRLRNHSKRSMVKYFEKIEPDLGDALQLIESDELKDLIKIWMNTQYLKSLDNVSSDEE